MPTILITGGTGLIGRALTRFLLDKKYQVIVLTRKIPANKTAIPGIRYALWDIGKKYIDPAAIAAADAIIHLAGAGVMDKRWNAAYKKEIVDSRVESSLLIATSLRTISNKVHTVVCASGIGWYGPDTAASLQNGFTEEAPADPAFLGETCRKWEESIEQAASPERRVIKLRTGIVLSREGGALQEFEKPIRMGVAGILGNGRQMVSWIHITDLCRLYLFAIENNSLQGACNAVAPAVVSNKTLTLTLARRLKGKFYIPLYIPSFVLKLILGESSIEVLKSCTCSAAKIKEAGFHFLFPSLEACLEQLYPESN